MENARRPSRAFLVVLDPEGEERSGEELYDQVRDRLFGSGSETAEPTPIDESEPTLDGVGRRLFGNAWNADEETQA